jgi:hypothetical protein
VVEGGQQELALFSVAFDFTDAVGERFLRYACGILANAGRAAGPWRRLGLVLVATSFYYCRSPTSSSQPALVSH